MAGSRENAQVVTRVLLQCGHRLSFPKASNDTYPPLARMRGMRHLCGTQPRSLHFENALSDTPSSRASLRNSFQSGAVTASLMAPSIYPALSIFQPLPCGVNNPVDWLQLVAMGADNDTAVTSKQSIRDRTKAAMKQWRALGGLTQAEAAAALGLEKRTYEKYEGDKRRYIPVDTIAAFCLVANIDSDWLLLGRRRRKPVPSLTRILKKTAQVA